MDMSVCFEKRSYLWALNSVYIYIPPSKVACLLRPAAADAYAHAYAYKG
jgi:hypothetical protein